jgi:hypothetical protein
MPNPTVGPESQRAGFAVGQQSSPFANIVKGAFEGAGFVNDLATSASQRENARTQAETQRRNQELAEQEFEFKTTTGVEQTNRELSQRDRQLDLQEQRNNDLRAIATEKNARMRTEKAIGQKNQIQKAQYESDMAELIVGGNADPFIAATKDPSRKNDLLRQIADTPQAKNQAAVDSIERAMLDGRIPAENIPDAQKALDLLQNAPKVTSTAENRAIQAEIIANSTGFNPLEDPSVRSMRWDSNTAEIIIERRDGTETRMGSDMMEDAERKAFLKAANGFNQTNRILESIHSKVAESAKNKNALSNAGNQTAPARSPRERQQLSELGSPKAPTGRGMGNENGDPRPSGGVQLPDPNNLPEPIDTRGTDPLRAKIKARRQEVLGGRNTGL